MKITYIHHSSFTAEYENAVFIFDYFKGNLPLFSLEKQIYIFASHKHRDHFDPEIFKLYNRYKNITYILSDDIILNDKYFIKNSIPLFIKQNIIFVSADINLNLNTDIDEIKIKTFKSTDEGVAFLVEYRNKTIYHAGDLNWWAWKEEGNVFNNKMEQNFKHEINKLKDVFIDIAFLPLDPRQEEFYSLGFDYFIDKTDVKKVFPMHFWGDYSVFEKISALSKEKRCQNKIITIKKEGQEFYL